MQSEIRNKRTYTYLVLVSSINICTFLTYFQLISLEKNALLAAPCCPYVSQKLQLEQIGTKTFFRYMFRRSCECSIQKITPQHLFLKLHRYNIHFFVLTRVNTKCLPSALVTFAFQCNYNLGRHRSTVLAPYYKSNVVYTVPLL